MFVYCGRNEWYPPKSHDAGIRALLAELPPGLPHLGSSADGPVSRHGPYRALTAPEYFRRADTKIHSEIGAPAIPPIESIRAMMPTHALWPLSLDYRLHDLPFRERRADRFLTLRMRGMEEPTAWKSGSHAGRNHQLRGMPVIFEAQSVHHMGTLLWMNHLCWPSFFWQTYDFYLQPTASYFGSKLGAEPLYI
ncbi:MAG: hypothetical protein ACRYFU_22040 [Janthinobacterium lividum]